jgi:hypothetical protein
MKQLSTGEPQRNRAMLAEADGKVRLRLGEPDADTA